MKRMFGVFCGIMLLCLSVAAQNETAPECLNLEEVQQKIGYPLEAKRAGASGKVVAKVTVDPNGKVSKSEITSSPSQLLSEAVLAHIGDLKFKPAKLDGKPIRSIVQVPILFEAGSSDKVFTSMEEALTTTEVVEQLDLSSKGLLALDGRITRLTSLRVIRLNDNQFTAMPKALSKLTALQEIEIGSNKLTKLPGWLKKLKSLQRVEISGNQIPADVIAKAKDKFPHIEFIAD